MSNSFATSRTIACQAPLSMGFSRQDYWSGLPLPPPGDLSKPMSPASPVLARRFLTTELPAKPLYADMYIHIYILFTSYYMHPMFTVALFKIAKIWNQPRCRLTDEWIQKMWYI